MGDCWDLGAREPLCGCRPHARKGIAIRPVRHAQFRLHPLHPPAGLARP